MTEYAGYIAVNPVDWSKIAKDATDDIMSVMDERQKKREELQKVSIEGQKEINKWTKSADSDMNKVLMAGAQNFRSYIQAQHDALKRGDITNEEFRSNVSNAQTNWKGLSDGFSMFGDNIQRHRQMVLDGTASGQQIANMQMYSKYATFSNVSIEAGADGRGYLKDATSEDGAIIPFFSISDPTNFFSKKVELTPQAVNFANTLAVRKEYDGEKDVYVTNQLFNDDLKREAIYGVFQNDDDIYARVLDDNNMGYTFDKEKAERLGIKFIEQKLGPDGSMHAIVTKEMRKEAEEALVASIESRLKYEETGFGTAAKQEVAERRVAAQEAAVGIRAQKEAREASEQTKEQKTAANNYNMKVMVDDFWKVNGQGSEFWKEVTLGKKSYGILDIADFVDHKGLTADQLKVIRIGKVSGDTNGSPNVTLVDNNGKEVIDTNGNPVTFQIKARRKYNISARYWNATHTGSDYTGKEIENATKPGGQKFGGRSKAAVPAP
jgi:hypothetical protein